MSLRPCLDCGELSTTARCDEHGGDKHHGPHNGTSRQRGYDATWDRLSRRARALQPFCTDCGTTESLSADHSPEAWKRKEAGKAIRLEDIDVVCLSCNSKRGAARGVGDRSLPKGPGGRRGSRRGRYSLDVERVRS